jgi:diaminopimelate decarboxylase
MVGAGSIGITSVADSDSKFGIRIDTGKDAILAAFAEYEWLSGLHVHVGSQGCDMKLLVRAVAAIEDLLEEVERVLGAGKISFVDIGGGLPVEYTKDDHPPSLDEYVPAMKAAAPRLFNGDIRLITEFGRAVQAGCGFAVSRVEYVKEFADHELAVIHLGADMFMRLVYLPDQWKHRLLVLDSRGQIKRRGIRRFTIGGPLCFAGDLVARNLDLPAIEPGDFVAIRDAGAYTISMWSRHCSRGLPKVVGFECGCEDAFRTLLRRETPSDVARFWGAADVSGI